MIIMTMKDSANYIAGVRIQYLSVDFGDALDMGKKALYSMNSLRHDVTQMERVTQSEEYNRGYADAVAHATKIIDHYIDLIEDKARAKELNEREAVKITKGYLSLVNLTVGFFKFTADFAGNWRKGDVVTVKKLDDGSILVDGVASCSLDDLAKVGHLTDKTECVHQPCEQFSLPYPDGAPSGANFFTGW